MVTNIGQCALCTKGVNSPGEASYQSLVAPHPPIQCLPVCHYDSAPLLLWGARLVQYGFIHQSSSRVKIGYTNTSLAIGAAARSSDQGHADFFFFLDAGTMDHCTELNTFKFLPLQRRSEEKHNPDE